MGMARKTVAAWEIISPLLDELLELDADQRCARLAEIRSQKPELADELASLLARQSAAQSEGFLQTVQREGFLEGSSLGGQVAPTLEGQNIGPYTLERPLGQGGMGSVWLGYRSDGRFEGKVAVKFLNLALLAGGGAKRFQREGSILARLAHPNIARLLDAGVSANGQPYLVLEYVEGETLDRYCDAHALNVQTRIGLFLEVLSAVEEAHRNLILHRDIKPSNILVAAGGRVKLLDFGIAKLLESETLPAPATELTQIGGRAFTPQYAAPEQIEGGNITTASDVYALGVLLYVLLAGRHPTINETRSSLEQLQALLQVEPPLLSEIAAGADNALASRRGCSPRELARTLSGDLENIVAKALKKSANERYATVAAFEADLRNYLQGRPVSARVDDRWYRTRKFIVRNRAAVAAVTAIAFALVAGAGVALWQRNLARAEAIRAREINRFVLSLFRSASPFESFSSDVRAVDLLKQAGQRIESELAGRPDLQAELFATLGSSLYDLAANQEARAAFRRALELYGWYRNSLPPAQAEETALNFADLLVIMGEYGEATKLIDRLEPRLRGRAPSLKLVELLNKRGLLLNNTGRAVEALRVTEEGLRLLNNLAVVPPMTRANLTLEFAREQYLADQNQPALDNAKLALGQFESLGAPARAAAVRTRALIARIVRDLGRTEEAIALLDAVLPEIRTVFGERSHDYLVNLAEHAVLDNDRGELEKAGSNLQQVLQIAAAKGGESSYSFKVWHLFAGVIAVQLRDLASAREHYIRSREYAAGGAEDLRDQFLLWQTQVMNGEQVPIPGRLRAQIVDAAENVSAPANVVVGAHCTLAWQDFFALRAQDAIVHFEAATGRFKGLRHYMFLEFWCMTGLGRALLAIDRLDRAEEVLTRSLQLQQERQVRVTPERAETLVALAELQLRRGRAQEAVTLAREADEFWQGFRPNSRYAGEAAIWHGRALAAVGQVAAGQKAVRRGLSMLAGSPFAIHRQLIDSLARR